MGERCCWCLSVGWSFDVMMLTAIGLPVWLWSFLIMPASGSPVNTTGSQSLHDQAMYAAAGFTDTVPGVAIGNFTPSMPPNNVTSDVLDEAREEGLMQALFIYIIAVLFLLILVLLLCKYYVCKKRLHVLLRQTSSDSQALPKEKLYRDMTASATVLILTNDDC